MGKTTKGFVRKRERYQTKPWRGFVDGYYRDFETQAEAFAWATGKVIRFRDGDIGRVKTAPQPKINPGGDLPEPAPKPRRIG